MIGQKGLRTAGFAATTFACFLVMQGAWAAVLTVGPGRMFSEPAAAAAAARPGDTVNIYPGTYRGALWTKRDLVIQGVGAGATISGPVVKGKGLFVIAGANITVKNLTFKGAKTGAGNGAGLRVEKTGLSVVNSHFEGNQNGILTISDKMLRLSVTGSRFSGNGTCAKSCAHALYTGRIASLTVRNSTFTGTRKGHHIKSRALATTIIGNTISDGAEGTSSYLVNLPNGGALTLTGNRMEKGPRSSNGSIAVSLGEEGASNPPGPMLVADNRFQNDGRATVFVRNATGFAGLLLSNNTLTGNKTTLLQGKGTIGAESANLARGADAPVYAAALAAPIVLPEPSSLTLFGAAAVAAFYVRWRRRKPMHTSATPNRASVAGSGTGVGMTISRSS